MKTYLITLALFAFVVFGFSQSIDSAEYFFDSDPGAGNGQSLSVNTNTGQLSQTYMIDVSGLSDGFHDLYIRTFNNLNNWSHYDKSTFYISSLNSGQNIIGVEYFYDLDNGVGTGTSIAINPQGTDIVQSLMIPTAGLDPGWHSLYIRTQIEDGTWSLYDKQIIYIGDFNNQASSITNAEYFIDVDPGFGLGEPLNITGSPQTFNFDTNGLSEGDHLFCIRVQNTDGTWSLFDCEIFTIDNALATGESLFDETKISPNPFRDILNIEIPLNRELLEVAVIDLRGKTVFHNSEGLKSLNLEYLEAGIYLLKLTTGNETTSIKLVKE